MIDENPVKIAPSAPASAGMAGRRAPCAGLFGWRKDAPQPEPPDRAAPPPRP